ncbi:MAG TPA: Gfo/Idh/MocA family oxidoreductase [Burkholderiales bacterium]
MIAAGLVGYGYWGPNLLRNLHASRRFSVKAVAELDPARLREAGAALPGIDTCDDAAALLARDDISAVVIATPVASHYALARRALELGKHVLVEKPLCRSSEECDELIALAARRGLTLMVDHTFLFTGAVRKLHELARGGALGRISYYDSLRVNLGLFQPDVNVLWDLAPHDFSILDHVIGAEPVHVEATGYCHVNARMPDIAYVTLHCAGDLIAHFNLSWMSPAKVRRVAIGGDRRMVVWDDLDRDERIRIYDSGIRTHAKDERFTIIPEYRTGDIHAPRIPNAEALAGVVRHFADVIEGRAASIMSGEHGRRVVRMLEAAQRALDASLARVRDGAARDGRLI